MFFKGLNSGIKSKILLICLFSLLIFPLNVQAKKYPVTWDPVRIEQTIGLGGTVDLSTTFVSNKKLKNVHLWVVPELQAFVSVEPTHFKTIKANTPYEVTVHFSVPQGTQTGFYDGTIHLKKGHGHKKGHKYKKKHKTYPHTLKVELNIADATATIGPEGGVVEVNDPSSPIYEVRIEIPEGAFIENELLSIQYIEDQVPVNMEKEELLQLPAFKIEPSIQLQKPAIISVPVNDSDGDGFFDGTDFYINSFNMYRGEEGLSGELYRVGTYYSPIEGRLFAETSRFSWWVPFIYRWKKDTVVYYDIEDLPGGINESKKLELQKAFDMWSDALSGVLLFQETPLGKSPNIIIYATNLCTSAWDKEYCVPGLTTYGHGLNPWTKHNIYLNTNFDNETAYIWVYQNYSPFPPSDEYDNQLWIPFLRIVAHEINHALGGKSFDDDTGALLNASYYDDIPDDIVRYDTHEFQTPLYNYPLTRLTCFDKKAIREEYWMSMQPNADEDLCPDYVDNCPDDYNPSQADSDGDGIGDVCEDDLVDYPNKVIKTITLGNSPRFIAVTPNGSYVYIVNMGSDTISVIRTSDNTVIDSIPVGDGPISLAVTPSGNHVFVANYFSDTVSVIRTSDNTIIGTIAVGVEPNGVTITPNGSYVYVTNWVSNSVSVIRTSDNTVIKTIGVGSRPYGVSITPNGSYVYVANHYGNSVSVIRTSDNSVIKTIAVGSRPIGITIMPNGSHVYVTNWLSNSVSVIRTSDNSVIDTISVSDNPYYLAVTPSGSHVYVTSEGIDMVSVIRTSDNSVIDTFTLGTDPHGVAISPDGSHVYVTNVTDNTVSVIGF